MHMEYTAQDISYISFVTFLLASSSALSDLCVPAAISTGAASFAPSSSAALRRLCSSAFSSSFSGVPAPSSAFSGVLLSAAAAFDLRFADRLPNQKRRNPRPATRRTPRVTPVPIAALVPVERPLFVADVEDGVEVGVVLVPVSADDAVELGA